MCSSWPVYIAPHTHQVVKHAFSASFPSMVSPKPLKSSAECSQLNLILKFVHFFLPHISMELLLEFGAFILFALCFFGPNFLFSNLFFYMFSCVQCPTLEGRQWLQGLSETASVQTIFVLLHLQVEQSIQKMNPLRLGLYPLAPHFGVFHLPVLSRKVPISLFSPACPSGHRHPSVPGHSQ